MPSLYVANASKQPQDFLYWVPEGKAPLRQKIPAGGQAQIYKPDLDTATIDHQLASTT